MAEIRDLTVIVVPLLGGNALAACLNSLSLTGVKCIVVLRAAMGAATSWARDYPAVTFIDAGSKTVPLRRWCGVEAARTELIALLEDSVRPSPGWCKAVCAAFAHPRVAAAGGPVNISAKLPSRFQALGWSEYGGYQAERLRHVVSLETDPHGLIAVSRLPGSNLAFRRLPLLKVLHKLDGGLVENRVFQLLNVDGLRLVFQPEMTVTYVAADRNGATLSSRLHHGRIYAAGVSAGRGWLQRFGLLAKSTLLPFVLPTRTLLAMTGKVRPAAMPALALWACLLESAWALGETMGYLTGPGNSMERWR